MPLNPEERMRQAEYEREQQQYARLTEEQQTIAELIRRLEENQDTINNLNSYIDKQMDRLIRINQAIELHNTGERSAGITLDTIKAVLR